MSEQARTPGPARIQRKRMKGWRMPEGAIYVGRPTKWGNPFWHAERFYGTKRALELYRETALGAWSPALVLGMADDGMIAYEDHQEWLRRMKEHPLQAARRELGGKDLACWCPLGQPCHADILLGA